MSLNREDYRPSRRMIFLSHNRSSCAAEQFPSDASLEAMDRRAPNNSTNWQWTTKVTSARDDRHLLRMAVNDRTASSRQLAARWSTSTSVLMIPLTANHRRLRLQWAHEHRAWQADWQQGVFSDEPRFNLGDHDDRIRVRHYADGRCLPECVKANT
ncbi:transposable element Tc1 transposase [Trichonephila clavipes]|nr:transposable element Tc1 transposase [Trichonephila clavipes]